MRRPSGVTGASVSVAVSVAVSVGGSEALALALAVAGTVDVALAASDAVADVVTVANADADAVGGTVRVAVAVAVALPDADVDADADIESVVVTDNEALRVAVGGSVALRVALRVTVDVTDGVTLTLVESRSDWDALPVVLRVAVRVSDVDRVMVKVSVRVGGFEVDDVAENVPALRERVTVVVKVGDADSVGSRDNDAVACSDTVVVCRCECDAVADRVGPDSVTEVVRVAGNDAVADMALVAVSVSPSVRVVESDRDFEALRDRVSVLVRDSDDDAVAGSDTERVAGWVAVTVCDCDTESDSGVVAVAVAICVADTDTRSETDTDLDNEIESDTPLKNSHALPAIDSSPAGKLAAALLK